MVIRVPVTLDVSDSDIAATISDDVQQGARQADAGSAGRAIGDQIGKQIRSSVSGAVQEGVDEGGRKVNTAGFVQSVDSELRGARGQFVAAGQDIGQGFGDGLTRGIDGKLRDARGRFVSSGEDAGEGFGQGFEDGATKSAPRTGKNFGKVLGPALKAGVAAAAVAAAAALTTGFLGALEKEKAVDKITASLALTDAQSKRAGEVAGNLYAGAWGDSLQDVTTAVESVISSIDGMADASTADLESVTASILDIATAFDLDVGEAARNAGILMKTGLAGDAQEAADLMTRSLQEVPVALRGEISDATQEYSQFFASIGIDGPQAMGLLTSSLEAGQFGVDKMGDAIKEFSLRATDLGDTGAQEAMEDLGLNAEATASSLLRGGDEAQKAFQKIITGLQGIDDPAEQAEAAIALFGTPLEDLGKGQIPEFLAGLNLTDVALQNVEGAASSMGDTLNDNVATRLEGLKRGVQTFLTDAMGALFTAFDQGSATAKELGGAFEGTRQAFEPVRATLIELAQAAQERLAPVFAEVGDRIKKDLLPALNDFGEAIAPIVNFIVKQVGPRITGTFESIGIVLGGLVEIVAGVFGTIAALIRGDWAGAWKNAQTIFRGFGNILRGILNQVAVQFGSTFSGMQRNALEIGQRIRAGFVERMTVLGATVRRILSNLPAVFLRAGERMLSSLVRSLVPAPVRERIRQIVETIRNLLNVDLSAAGRDVLLSLARGMISGLSAVAAQASAAAATIRSYFPFSPAKTGPLSGPGSPENSGKQIAELLAQGLMENVNLPARAMEQALSPLAPTGVTQAAGLSSQAVQGAPVASGGVSIQQVFTGPTTSGGRLQELNWNLRYATQARREVIGGVPIA